jgi:HlyD family secretion protein
MRRIGKGVAGGAGTAVIGQDRRKPTLVSIVRRHAPGIALALAIAIGGATLVWLRVIDKPVDVYSVVRGNLVQSVVASGQVITPQRASIASEITGRVARVPVDEGDTVRRDQVLVELDQSDERAALAQAQAARAQAQAKLAQMTASALPMAMQSLAQAQANLTQAERTYQRTSDLVASHFVSPSQLDDAKRNLDIARSQVRTAQLQVVNARPGGADYLVAQTSLREAEAQVTVAEAKLAATLIRAPSNGVLIARSVESGDVAQAGKELLVLAPAGETQLVVNIDERNLGKLALGQKALASADAFPGDTFAADLFYVNPGIDAVRGAVQVKLRVPDPPAYLRQDMTVSVDIEVARRNDVLIAPADALHDAATREPWVLTVHGGRTAKQPVTLGLRGDSAVEIVSGLTAGDVMVPATNVRVREGQHVRPVTFAAGRAR